jgi:uncharacterized protein
MSLEDRIMGDLKEAMKAKDKAALRGIRAIKSALLLAKTDGSGEVMDEAKEIKMLQKLVKQREESLSIYVKQQREDLAEIEKEELDILKRYLPTPLSDAELTTIIKQIIADTGASGIKDMGKVMGLASAKLGGKADGKTISNVVKSLLV